jgi:hypothetical protein
MKSIKSLFLIGLAFLALALNTRAADTVYTFSQTSTDIGATNSHVIISANGPGSAQVDYVSVTSDKAGSQLLFYTASTGIPITLATNASQAVVYAVGTGNFSANDKVVLRHVATDTYERLVVSSVAATTVTFTANPTAATVAGDIIYKMTAGAYVPVGAATKEIIGTSYIGQLSKPIYVEIDGTSASQINLISGVFAIRR